LPWHIIGLSHIFTAGHWSSLVQQSPSLQQTLFSQWPLWHDVSSVQLSPSGWSGWQRFCQQKAPSLQVEAVRKPPQVPVAQGGGGCWSSPPRHLTGRSPQASATTVRSHAESLSSIWVPHWLSMQAGICRVPWHILGSVQAGGEPYVVGSQSVSAAQQSPMAQQKPLPQ
jgi:hypothetical protein